MKPLKVYENFEKFNVYGGGEGTQNCNVVCDSRKMKNHHFYQHDHKEKILITQLSRYVFTCSENIFLFSEP